MQQANMHLILRSFIKAIQVPDTRKLKKKLPMIITCRNEHFTLVFVVRMLETSFTFHILFYFIFCLWNAANSSARPMFIANNAMCSEKQQWNPKTAIHIGSVKTFCAVHISNARIIFEELIKMPEERPWSQLEIYI